MKIYVNSKVISGEEAFIRKAFEIRNNNADVIMVVPYSVLSSSILNHFRIEFKLNLKEIIALPSGSIRNTQVKAAILVLGTNNIESIQISILSNFNNLTEDYIKSDKKIIKLKDLKENWDPLYYMSKGNDFYDELDSFKTVKLTELAAVLKGRNILSDKLLDEGQLVYLKPVHIQEGRLITKKSVKYVNKDTLSSSELNCILLPGDIVISTIFNDLKMFVYKAGDVPAFASNNLAVIRSSNQDYISSYLQTSDGKRIFYTQANNLKRGNVIPHLTLNDLASIKIPLLPLAELNSIGNQSISNATSSQLEETLVLLQEYKNRIDKLEKEIKNNSIKEFIEDRFNRIESQINIVNQKLDKILDIINDLKSDFDAIRILPRADEEKLFKLCQKIDGKLDSIYAGEKVTIEGYIEEIKRWLDLWELLERPLKKTSLRRSKLTTLCRSKLTTS